MTDPFMVYTVVVALLIFATMVIWPLWSFAGEGIKRRWIVRRRLRALAKESRRRLKFNETFRIEAMRALWPNGR